MNHAVHVLGFPTDDPATVLAPSGLTQQLDAVTLADPTQAGLIGSVVEPLMGLTLTNVVASPGDTLTVVGPVGEIPDYQVGLTLLLDAGGVWHFPNAGHLAAAFTAAQE